MTSKEEHTHDSPASEVSDMDKTRADELKNEANIAFKGTMRHIRM